MACLLLASALGGCSQRPIAEPVAEAFRATAASSRRVAAVNETPDPEAFELMPLVLSSRHPLEVRRAAVDRMVHADADRFWSNTAASIRRVNDWPMITHLSKRAAQAGRADFIPALIQSWARPSIRYVDDDRPERQAISRLVTEQAVADTLWNHFTQADTDSHTSRTAIAAWTILCRVQDQSQLRRGLTRSPARHELHQQLIQIAPAVHILPRDREEVLRMRSVLSASSPDPWPRRVAALQISAGTLGDTHIALRHLPAIDHADPAALRPDAAGILRSDLQRRLTTARHVSRGAGDHGQAYIRSTPDALTDHDDALGWADLLVMQMALDALKDPDLVASLFAQAERDRVDTETERGGIMTWDTTGHLVAQAFEPWMRRHDEIYIASDDCIRAMHTGLAHYHFHAQRYDNANWAGPGGGDFTFANNLHANCIVFTFIDRDTLNVDLYFPGEIVVDLGCIHR